MHEDETFIIRVMSMCVFCCVFSGLREAKMRVLEQIQKVMVRDIQKFVDWLKTVRVEYSGGGKCFVDSVSIL